MSLMKTFGGKNFSNSKTVINDLKTNRLINNYESHSQMENNLWSFSISCDYNKRRISVIGQGSGKSRAKQNACDKLIKLIDSINNEIPHHLSLPNLTSRSSEQSFHPIHYREYGLGLPIASSVQFEFDRLTRLHEASPVEYELEDFSRIYYSDELVDIEDLDKNGNDENDGGDNGRDDSKNDQIIESKNPPIVSTTTDSEKASQSSYSDDFIIKLREHRLQCNRDGLDIVHCFGKVLGCTTKSYSVNLKPGLYLTNNPMPEKTRLVELQTLLILDTVDRINDKMNPWYQLLISVGIFFERLIQSRYVIICSDRQDEQFLEICLNLGSLLK